VRWMTQLNRDGAEIAVELGARAATDVTGFGLLGHATEMAAASGVTLQFALERVPLMAGTRTYADAWTFPGGSANNRLAYRDSVRFADEIPESAQMLLFDAQTSGGLLIALPVAQRAAFADKMAARGASWWEVGVVQERADVPIVVTP
jgi:selenide,water dikinase